MRRRDAEVKATVEGTELRIRDMEKRVSALDQDRLECAGRRLEFDRLNGRLSLLEDCLQRAVDGCSSLGTPPTPASSPIPSSAHSSTTSSTTSVSSPAFSSTPTIAFPTPTPSPSEVSERLPSAASTAPPTPDSAPRRDLGEELYEAARDTNEQDVELLLDAGADPNYGYHNGFTPLMTASEKGHAPIVSLLLRRGANVHAGDNNRWTALHFAAYNDRSGRAVSLLVTAGARVDSRDRWGSTPLYYAAVSDNVAAARALVTAGASKTLKDDYGRIPLDRARSDAVRALLRP